MKIKIEMMEGQPFIDETTEEKESVQKFLYKKKGSTYCIVSNELLDDKNFVLLTEFYLEDFENGFS